MHDKLVLYEYASKSVELSTDEGEPPLKLMIDRLVCADGGNPDPTSTHGKKPEEAKALELEGWGYPKHLDGRAYGVVVHGDVAGIESVRRNLCDWLDWMMVEAWNVEHNQLHHYHLGEVSDPDLVEHNMDYLRNLDCPMAIKYAACVFMAFTWKWWYYAPNTFKQLKANERRRKGIPQPGSVTAPQTFDFGWLIGRGDHTHFSGTEFLVRCLGPYFVQRFVLAPLPFLMISYQAYFRSLITLALAELCTNLHSFIVIATNHAGFDLYRFEKHCKPRSSTFYLRQVISSADYNAGTDFVDYLHGWLNYQVEHHIWPNLSMLSYQKAAPEVKAICAKHGVPYVQQNVFKRLKETADIMVG